jgi:hypothetical protein
MADKTLRKAKSPEAADYRAAWRACRKLVPGEESDLDTIAVTWPAFPLAAGRIQSAKIHI